MHMVFTAKSVCLLLMIAGFVHELKSLRWCADKNFANCNNLNISQFDCVDGSSEADCYEKIANKQADAGVFDGGSMIAAGKKHGLKVIMAENLKNAVAPETSYYAIAVSKTTNNIQLNGLKGKKSCHTGVQKTSGWVVPVGTLLRKKYMSWVNCDQYASVGGFFSASCAPGGKNTKYNTKSAEVDKLCKLCNGTGSNKCERGSKEPYYGYSGAFKCLADGKGDVAFIKAAILNDLPAAEQAKYRLLCLDNTRAEPKDYKKCNLARVPSHGVMVRDDKDSETFQDFLIAADPKLKNFTTYGNGLFSSNTVNLQKVDAARQPYEKYLDKAYMEDYKTLDGCVSSSAKCIRGLGGLFVILVTLAYGFIY